MEFLPALVLFAASSSFTPGPNNIMIMASGLNFGIRRSLPHMCGICIGFAVMLAVVGSGVGYLFERHPNLHELIKLIGVCYLAYLAWKIASSAPNGNHIEHAKPQTFIQAALFQWVNPKALVMGTSAIATFTTVGADISLQVFIVVTVFFLMTWPAVGAWLLFGASLQRILRNPRQQRIFNIGMALLLLASMYGVIVELVRHYFSIMFY